MSHEGTDAVIDRLRDELPDHWCPCPIHASEHTLFTIEDVAVVLRKDKQYRNGKDYVWKMVRDGRLVPAHGGYWGNNLFTAGDIRNFIFNTSKEAKNEKGDK